VQNKPFLHTCLSPALLHLYDLKDTIVVVIDVFRATSTIASALYNGAAAVIPVDTVSGAIDIAKEINGIAAGERDGKIADGLQYGNSPLEYHRDFIGGKNLVLTTTNGTKLLYMALENGATDIMTGSFPNLGAVCDYLLARQQNVVLACAGWKDRFNMEDTLFAGAVIDQINHAFISHCDSSTTALNLYQQMKNDLIGNATKFTHYHRLVERFGLIDDIRFCLTPNVANIPVIYREGQLIKG
jgi:2-phosphosulfolactate phosphatase